MPSEGTFTGRTFANRSSALRIATFALSILGQGSPARGVVVGPFKITWQAFSSSITSSGIACICATRFSIVSPLISLMQTLPLAISCASIRRKTVSALFVIIGPIPSPPQTPITRQGSLSYSIKSPAASIFSLRAS